MAEKPLPLTAEEQARFIEWATDRYDMLSPLTSRQHLEETLRWHATVEQRDKEIERLQYWEKQHIACTAALEARVAELEEECRTVGYRARRLQRAYELERDSLNATGLHSLNAEVMYDATAWIEQPTDGAEGEGEDD